MGNQDCPGPRSKTTGGLDVTQGGKGGGQFRADHPWEICVVSSSLPCAHTPTLSDVQALYFHTNHFLSQCFSDTEIFPSCNTMQRYIAIRQSLVGLTVDRRTAEQAVSRSVVFKGAFRGAKDPTVPSPVDLWIP